MEIDKLLHQIQKELDVPKNQFNKFGGYKYRSCEDILAEAKKLLPENVILLLSDQIVLIGSRYYVEATATLQQGNEKISVKAYARESETKKGMDESQITGSSSSYARKYALNGLFMIDDVKDADTINEHGKSETELKLKSKTSSAEESAGIRNRLLEDMKTDITVEALHTRYKRNIKDILVLTEEDKKKVMDAFTIRKKEIVTEGSDDGITWSANENEWRNCRAYSPNHGVESDA